MIHSSFVEKRKGYGLNINSEKKDYQKYSYCRTDLKKLIQEKMRSNLNNDEDDPALISKNFGHILKQRQTAVEFLNRCHTIGLLRIM